MIGWRVRRCLTAALGLAALAAGGCRPEPEAPQDAPPPKRTVAATNVVIAWQEPGPDGRVRPLLNLEADEGTLEQDKQSGAFERARGRVYRDGALMARITAPHVVASMPDRIVKARGGVTVTSERPPGLTVRADRIDWLLNENRVIALGNVRFVQRDAETGQALADGGVFGRVTLDTERQRLTIP